MNYGLILIGHNLGDVVLYWILCKIESGTEGICDVGPICINQGFSWHHFVHWTIFIFNLNIYLLK